MRNRLWILLWVLGILFPMAFLGKLWPGFGRVFNALFAPDWMHVVMHGFLYLVLGILLTLALRPAGPRTYILLLGLALAVGVLHEGVQLLAAGAWPGWGAELLDISVDMVGAYLGVGLAVLYRKRRFAEAG
jgi:VanZ family protein